MFPFHDSINFFIPYSLIATELRHAVFYVDSNGVSVGPGRCFSVGSGSSIAYSVADDGLATAQATGRLEDAVELALRAVKHSTHRDSYSGGFINVFKVDEFGCHHLKRVDSRSMSIKP